jgi:hypothetical protein
MITTRPRHVGFSGRHEDRTILRNGTPIGTVWYCSADYVKRGQRTALDTESVRGALAERSAGQSMTRTTS